MMNQTLGAVLCIVIGALTTAFAFAQTKTDPLAASFLNPPPSAQPQVWWHWVNGNVSKAGITADLEGWKRVGIGGGTICNLGDFADPGPAHFNSDVWWDDTKFAMSEAARLGLELGVENCEGWSSSGGPWIKPEDAMKMLVWSETRVKGVDSSPVHVVQPLTRNDFYRDVAVLAFPSPPAGPGSAGSNALHASDVVNLTSKLRSDGTIAWTPPAGAWTILRIGYTNTGAVNHPASKYGIGLECDKLSKVALEHHFAGFFDHVAATCATIPGNPLKWSLIDSYEVGAQNWTDDLPAQFKNRNGYDITPWLITLAGRDLESADQTHRFNFDFTRTISEMWDSNYWGYFADLLHKLGLKGQVEPYGNGAFDTLRSSGLVDMPMSEFWYPGQGVVSLGKQVASGAHVYGHTLVGAESFTAGGQYFSATPWNMKRAGDAMFAAGINRYYFHSGAHQPWTDGRAPGMTWAFGMFQNRNNTWYEPGKAYFRYVGRCESLLQQGRFIGDILAYEGEEGNGGQALNPAPAGYAADEIDRDWLQQSVTVDNGALALPDGERYKILVLANTDTISLPVLEKIDSLVRDGAIVFGQRPAHTLGLTGYPESETKLAAIASKLWGNIDGQTVIKNHVGKGWVYWTGAFKNVPAALDDLQIAPDFSFDNPAARIVYLHRRIDQADVYFLSNQVNGPVSTNVTFRVSGKQPEIWNPEAGTLSDAAVWASDSAAATRVALQLNPGQSLFVVFRKPAPANHLVSMSFTPASQAGNEVKALVITKATYGDIAGHAGTVDLTAKLKAAMRNNQVDVVLSNQFAESDPAPMIPKSARIEYTLGGVPGTATVQENDSLTLPPYNAAEAPFRLTQNSDGTVQIATWSAGSFTGTDASGKTVSKQIASTPQPVTLDGAWDVHFNPRWGGPSMVHFDSLADWTKRPETGIKYYSGTAEYDKTFEAPDGWVKPGRTIYLDLGDLESLANVTLNGHDLGCLWSPPYRANVTGIVKAGANALQIRVTNTWVNRLIHDESLPVANRVTWTVGTFYAPTDPLIPSGLFGPVTLIGADEVEILKGSSGR